MKVYVKLRKPVPVPDAEESVASTVEVDSLEDYDEVPWLLADCSHSETMCPDCREQWESDHFVRSEPESDYEIVEETLYEIRKTVNFTTYGAIQGYVQYWLPIAPDQNDPFSKMAVEVVARMEDFANYLRSQQLGIVHWIH